MIKGLRQMKGLRRMKKLNILGLIKLRITNDDGSHKIS